MKRFQETLPGHNEPAINCFLHPEEALALKGTMHILKGACMRYYTKQKALSRSHSQHPEGGPTAWSRHWGVGELTAVWEGRLSPLGAEDID